MKITILLTLILFFGLLTGPVVIKGQRSSPQSRINRNLKLESAVSQKYSRFMSLLRPEAKTKLAIISRLLLNEITKGRETNTLEAAALSEVNKRFSGLSAGQADLLSFCALADIAQFESNRLEGGTRKANLESAKDAMKNDLDSMSEMGEMESLRLQMAMDRMSKLMSTLSNILKKISDSSDQIVQNIK